MSQNALLRSVKVLSVKDPGVPSPARKDNRKVKLAVEAAAPVEDRADHFAIRIHRPARAGKSSIQ